MSGESLRGASRKAACPLRAASQPREADMHQERQHPLSTREFVSLWNVAKGKHLN